MKMDWRNTLELLTPPEMAGADAAAIAAGTPGSTLMERAGAAVADEAARLALPMSRSTPRIAVVCGPGNNGGDGYVAARCLAGRGFAVSVFALSDPSAIKGDAAEAARSWTGAVASVATFSPGDFDLVIDALFGAGLSRDLDGEARKVVDALNAWRRLKGGKVLAVDVPSGLDGETGLVRGVAVEADSTVTFFRLKPGHLLYPGRLLCGDLRLSHIGISDECLKNLAYAAFLNGPRLWVHLLPRPRPEGHKYSRGHALVVSGPARQTGAARLAALSAARAGAGLVTIAGQEAALAEHASHVTAIMLATCRGPSDLVRILADTRKNALVIGPGLGLGSDAEALLAAALTPGNGRAAVLDADALTLGARQPELLRDLVGAFGGPVVLTPHEGEFSRFSRYLDRSVESLSQVLDSASQRRSKADRARRLAASLGAVVLLKGPDTVVACPDGRISISTDLPPALATAGSGDVLAGLIGGLLAQNMPPFEAVSAAAWLHGAAARMAGPRLTADDLPGAVSAALATM